MRFSIKSVLVVLVSIAAVIALVVFIPEGREQQDVSRVEASQDATPAGSTSVPSDGGASNPSSTSAEAAGVPAEIRDFIAAYADPTSSDAQWGKALAPSTTPALHASLVTSDRDLARDAGGEIVGAEDGRVSVGTPTSVAYVLEYEQLEDDPEQDEAPAPGGSWRVTAIDFMDPPRGTALPLGSDAVEQVRAPVQEALTAVVTQPGGQSDEDRAQLIRDTFTDPQDAAAIPRRVQDGAAVRIGNAHELVLAADGDQLVVYATVPYARDGESTPSWITVTVSLDRSDSGTWIPQDAHI